MKINQSIQFENDTYQVKLHVPTLANIQPLLDYARPQIQNLAKMTEEGMYIPSTEDLQAGVNAVKDLIEEFKDEKGEDIAIEDIGLSEATFLTGVALQLYVECTKQSAIRKK